MAGTIAINHYIWPANHALEPFLDCAVEAGAGAVGLTARAIAETGSHELSRLLEARGLGISSINSVGYLTGRAFGDVEDIDLHNRQLLDAAAALPSAPVCVIVGGVPAGEDLASSRAKVASRLPKLVAEAGHRQVSLAVEPIHPAELVPKGVVNSIAQALSLLKIAPELRLIVDLYHSWWDPDLGALLKTGADRIALLQVSGVRENGAGGFTRCLPDDGLVDVGAIISNARAGGYRGPIEFEMFADQLKGVDPKQAVFSAVRILSGMMG